MSQLRPNRQHESISVSRHSPRRPGSCPAGVSAAEAQPAWALLLRPRLPQRGRLQGRGPQGGHRRWSSEGLPWLRCRTWRCQWCSWWTSAPPSSHPKTHSPTHPCSHPSSSSPSHPCPSVWMLPEEASPGAGQHEEADGRPPEGHEHHRPPRHGHPHVCVNPSHPTWLTQNHFPMQQMSLEAFFLRQTLQCWKFLHEVETLFGRSISAASTTIPLRSKPPIVAHWDAAAKVSSFRNLLRSSVFLLVDKEASEDVEEAPSQCKSMPSQCKPPSVTVQLFMYLFIYLCQIHCFYLEISFLDDGALEFCTIFIFWSVHMFSEIQCWTSTWWQGLVQFIISSNGNPQNISKSKFNLYKWAVFLAVKNNHDKPL